MKRLELANKKLERRTLKSAPASECDTQNGDDSSEEAGCESDDHPTPLKEGVVI